MNRRFIWLFLFLVLVYVIALFLIVGVNKARGDVFTEFINSMSGTYVENASLRDRIKKLEAENAELKSLLGECYTALQESNTVIEDLSGRIKTVTYLYNEQGKELAKAKQRYFVGGGISYPLGGEIIGGRLWNKVGVYVSSGYLGQATIKGGLLIRIK
jgi:peptidoglycan hydrolase CwlO-like protein